jgi:hypothetical protein
MTPFDAADYLDTDDVVAEFVAAAADESGSFSFPRGNCGAHACTGHGRGRGCRHRWRCALERRNAQQPLSVKGKPGGNLGEHFAKALPSRGSAEQR